MREEIIKRTVERICEENKIKVLKIILFGSRARGNYKERSDWDLLIVVDKKLLREERLKISHLIRKALADEFIPCDVLIKSEKEVEKRKDIIGSVIRSAVKEGIIL